MAGLDTFTPDLLTMVRWLPFYSAVPALIIFVLWSMFSPGIIESMVMAELPSDVLSGGTAHSLLYSQIMHVAQGIKEADQNWLAEASYHFIRLNELGTNIRFCIFAGTFCCWIGNWMEACSTGRSCPCSCGIDYADISAYLFHYCDSYYCRHCSVGSF